MQRITREQARKYTFDWRDEPLLRVKPGERFDQMCRVGKLSYVAGAELPKRYLA